MPVKPLPIAIECDCGEGASVPYGERWTCPRCGRTYDTNRIPAAEMARIDAVRRRYRRAGYAVGAVIALLVLVLVLTSNPIQLFLALPAMLMVWFIYGRPLLQRRYRKALGTLPRYDLHAEQDPDPDPR